MPFPSSNILTLDDAWKGARTITSQIKAICSSNVAQANAGTLNGANIVNLAGYLYNAGVQLATYGAVSGMAAYAQSMSQDSNVVADFLSVQSAITATIQWIIANFPKDSQNFLQYVTFDGNGNAVLTVFSPSVLSGFITQLNALIATIS